jgi:hypothetical protein
VLGLPLASPSAIVADGVTPIFGYVITMVDAAAPIFPFVFVAVRILPVHVIEPDVPPPISPMVTEPDRTFGKYVALVPIWVPESALYHAYENVLDEVVGVPCTYPVRS